MRSGRYILQGHTPTPCEDLFRWAAWFKTADRRVAFTELAPGVRVLTWFLALDFDHGLTGIPQLFETMAFNDFGQIDDVGGRWMDWAEAEEGHRVAVEQLRKRLALEAG